MGTRIEPNVTRTFPAEFTANFNRRKIQFGFFDGITLSCVKSFYHVSDSDMQIRRKIHFEDVFDGITLGCMKQFLS